MKPLENKSNEYYLEGQSTDQIYEEHLLWESEARSFHL